MSKRGGTKVVLPGADFRPTPAEAVAPLLPHLPPRARFIEPCAGDGALVRHLRAVGHGCSLAIDIEPRGAEVLTGNALDITGQFVKHCDLFITNPPWTRSMLHPLIEHLSALRPTWLLFDANWQHQPRNCRPLWPLLRKIVNVGQVRWLPNTRHKSFDYAAWYLFDANSTGAATIYPRED